MSNIDNFTRKHSKFVLTVLVLVFVMTLYLFANPSGRSGRTSTTSSGCGSCHGSSASTAVTVTCTSGSGSFTVQPNSTTTFTVTVSHSSLPRAAVNIAVKTDQTGTTNAGTLNPGTGSGLSLSSSELVQNTPKVMSGGSASFNFTWTAPATPGTYYLRSIGMAANNQNGDDSGDLWNWMSIQAITVEAPSGSITLSSPVGTESWCPGSSHNITWTSSSVTNVKIELSTDGGSTFPTTLVASTLASANSWTWNIPAGQTAGTQYKVRISDVSSAGINSVSTNNFTIPGAPVFSVHPQTKSACTGSPASFTVTTTGAVASYKWQKNGVDIPSSNLATYSISSVTPNDTGNYVCIVTNTCGTQATSNSAYLTVNLTPAIATQPVNKEVCSGENVTFSVTATGTQLNYQWRKNTVPISNAISSTCTITGVKAVDAGNYDVIVNGICQTPQTSQQATLKVNLPPTITKQPQTVYACPGSKTLIYVTATGTGLQYQWKKNGVDIPNSNNDTLFFNNVVQSDSAVYEVNVTGTCSPMAVATACSLVVSSTPNITDEPKDLAVNEGANSELSVTATGTNLKYQWRKEGTKLTGKTASKLTFTGVKLSDAGSYDCIIASDCGSDTSAKAKLTVNSSSGPVLSLSVESLDFGNVLIGNKKDTTLTAFLKNIGTSDLTINSMNIAGAGSKNFKAETLTFPITLKKDETKGFTITLNPSDTGNITASLNFTSNDVTNPVCNLTGFGAFSVIEVSSKKLTFSFPDDKTSFMTSDVNLQNRGNVPVNVQLNLEGTDKSNFSFIPANGLISLSPDEVSTATVKCELNGKTSVKANFLFENLFSFKSDTVYLDGTLGINSVKNNIDNSSFLVIPNPAENNLTIQIESKNQIDGVSIYNLNGTLVQNLNPQNIGNGSIQWDCKDTNGNSLPKGEYIILMKSGNTSKSHKIILK